MCPFVLLILQQNTFTIPMYLMPIQGVDVVLGMSWLRTLGTVTSDFSVPSVTFTHNSSQLTLTGHSHPSPTPLTHHQLNRDLTTNSLAYAYSILYISPQYHQYPDSFLAIQHLEASLTSLTHPNPAIQNLLNQFTEVFATLQGLPPQRPHDHYIHLLPNSSPSTSNPTDVHIATKRSWHTS